MCLINMMNGQTISFASDNMINYTYYKFVFVKVYIFHCSHGRRNTKLGYKNFISLNRLDCKRNGFSHRGIYLGNSRKISWALWGDMTYAETN